MTIKCTKMLNSSICNGPKCTQVYHYLAMNAAFSTCVSSLLLFGRCLLLMISDAHMNTSKARHTDSSHTHSTNTLHTDATRLVMLMYNVLSV